MIRVKVIKTTMPYEVDYEAWLTGWVVLEGVVHGMVFTDNGDMAWPVRQLQIEMTV